MGRWMSDDREGGTELDALEDGSVAVVLLLLVAVAAE